MHASQRITAWFEFNFAHNYNLSHPTKDRCQPMQYLGHTYAKTKQQQKKVSQVVQW